MSKRTLFYDTEIARCIPDKWGKDSRYDYCEGWHDFKGMGVAVVGAWSSWQGPDVFLGHQLDGFQRLVDQADEVVGFNSISFDDKLMRAHGVKIETTYDLMREVRRAAGEPLTGPCTRGYNLGRLAEENLGEGKSGTGDLAPKLWQQGKFGEVIRYCQRDVRLLKALHEMRGYLKDPVCDRYLHCLGGDIRPFRRMQRQQWINETLKPWQIALWAVMHHEDGANIHFTSPVKITLQRPVPIVSWRARSDWEHRNSSEPYDEIPF